MCIRDSLNSSSLLDAVVGGWQLAGTLILQDGQPFTPIMASSTNSYSLAQNNFQWFPNVIGNPKLQHPTPLQWFNEAAFAVPASGTFGDEHRNQLTGPGFEQTNLGLGKTFHFTEGINLEMRADANNAFNHPTLGLPNQSLNVCPSAGLLPAGCGGYGAIATGTSTINSLATGTTQNGRTLQLSAHLTF